MNRLFLAILGMSTLAIGVTLLSYSVFFWILIGYTSFMDILAPISGLFFIAASLMMFEVALEEN